MTPQSTKHPIGRVKELIDSIFKTFEQFKEQFSKAALSVFGSGWAWLVLTKEHRLKIMITHNQNTPMSDGLLPLLALDVWEHAYYLKYQNSRAEYIQAWWHVVNWEQVEKNYLTALEIHNGE
jgi:Fe-Mn family superoxide dismutase